MKRKSNLRKLISCSLFCALICVGAFIKIPIPPVPITMQTFFVVLAGIVLGAGSGVACMLVYALLGIAGLPVFSGGGGIGYVLTPYFGYIIGFVAAAYAGGRLAEKGMLLASFVATAVIYLCEAPWFIIIQKFYIGSEINIGTLVFGFLLVPFTKDILLCPLAAMLGRRLKSIL